MKRTPGQKGLLFDGCRIFFDGLTGYGGGRQGDLSGRSLKVMGSSGRPADDGMEDGRQRPDAPAFVPLTEEEAGRQVNEGDDGPVEALAVAAFPRL